MFNMNKLDLNKRVRIIQAMVEGCSLRSITRMTGASINTVSKLLVDAGTASLTYQDRVLRGLTPKRIQCDEIWSFCYAKQKNVPPEKQGIFGYGDVWTWVAMDADSKLIITWRVGLRTAEDARALMNDLAGRVTSIADLTTDGFGAYPAAVREAFGGFVSYAQVIKHYGRDTSESEMRYSPPKCTGVTVYCINGNPDRPSTSHVERQNLTMRMGMRRFTRLTNAFGKKVENSAHSIALHFMHYNFCRIHKTLRVTPAMAAGLTDHIWEIADIVKLIEDAESN